MPRRSGGGGWSSSGRSSGGGGSWLPWSSSRSSPRPAADKPKKSPLKPASPAPPPAPVQSQPAAGGLASSFADGGTPGICSIRSFCSLSCFCKVSTKLCKYELFKLPGPPSCGSLGVAPFPELSRPERGFSNVLLLGVGVGGAAGNRLTSA
ncbi:uncharacterized protein LOC142170661 isoform X2 [Nicotiana tabacum]|uniref:Uncharacterized protein LOC142170661 isoform X2 n=2 Tax=Nicotiana tabacum TaxID=4097 RepID=A0AC58SV20_TOBAC